MSGRHIWRTVVIAVVLIGGSMLPRTAVAAEAPAACAAALPGADLLGLHRADCPPAAGTSPAGFTGSAVATVTPPAVLVGPTAAVAPPARPPAATSAAPTTAAPAPSTTAAPAPSTTAAPESHAAPATPSTQPAAPPSPRSSAARPSTASDASQRGPSDTSSGTSGRRQQATPRAPAGGSSTGALKLSGGTVQWRGDFNTDDTSQWDLETAKPYSLRVQDGGAGHTTAGRFEVRDGDHPVDSGERSEAKPPDWTDVSDGDERWYSFSMMFDRSFPTPVDGWCDPMQWHPANSDHSAAEGSPPLNLQCGPNDVLYLEVGDEVLLPIGKLDRGVWHHYLLHVRFSNDPDVAFEEVHRDGQLVLPRTSPRLANMTTPKLYLKIGMYRHARNDGPMVVWHDDMAVYSTAPTLTRG